jgi:hypothetical protein
LAGYLSLGLEVRQTVILYMLNANNQCSSDFSNQEEARKTVAVRSRSDNHDLHMAPVTYIAIYYVQHI